ncbi:hypothetical protein VTO42DRAFT_3537 [Malbranchea cinnamomea]
MTSTSLKRKSNSLSDESAENKKPRPNGTITSFFGPPKGTGSTAANGSGPVSRFDKAKWVSSLTPEQRALLQLEIDTLHESWLAHLKDELVTKEFLDLKRFLKKELDSGVKVFPPLEDVYSWSRYTPLHKVKVVILGQDPYHNYGQAHGLSFSVRPPTPAPPSLLNIYKALQNDYPSFQPPPNNGGLLTPWAERGVLMLNACLTVRAHNANSHANRGWETFTQKVIDTVARVRTNGVVFLAWGAAAGKRVAHILKDRHCVLRSAHPSPLSASRGFFTCGHFKKANEWLEKRYGPDGIIDWNLGPVADPTPSKQTTGESQATGQAGDEKDEVETTAAAPPETEDPPSDEKPETTPSSSS